jgi:hypothetical protein
VRRLAREEKVRLADGFQLRLMRIAKVANFEPPELRERRRKLAPLRSYSLRHTLIVRCHPIASGFPM